MYIYEVHVETNDAFKDAFERYMRGKHLREILATGCFARITFERETPVHFRARYYAKTQDDLDRYLNEHTAAFRADFLMHFPEGMKVWREVWEEVEVFEE